MRAGPDEDPTVRCIACGATLPRSETREYDALGDRWDREDKSFEYLCKPCHAMECHLPRGELESTLVSVGRHDSAVDFVTSYYDQVAKRVDPEERTDG